MTLLFVYPGNEALGQSILAYSENQKAGFEQVALTVHNFPDGESLIRLDTPVNGQDVVLLCSLDHPDDKAMPLMFFAQTARDLGARSLTLAAPYLGYMRQDTRFHDGEAITADIFAAFISQHFDRLVTIDPHLHRHKTMDEIYTIPATALHATTTIASWVKGFVEKPLLIGPDEESKQWVADVAEKAALPFTVLKKIRHGDKDVDISVPDIGKYSGHIPVLVDDIISTARTMIETIKHLQEAGTKPPVCIGVHAVFAGDAYQMLQNAGPADIVTCNTIPHPSNKIDISALLLEKLIEKL